MRNGLFAALVCLTVTLAAVSTVQGATLAPRLLPHLAEQYKRAVVASAHSEFGLNAPVADLAAQIEAESGWHASAASGVGAQGLAEFMPDTALDMAKNRPDICAPANPFSAAWAIRCQAAYMASLYKAIVAFPPKLAGDLSVIPECDHWAMTFSAYNGGIGWLLRDRALTVSYYGDANRWYHSVYNYTMRNDAAAKENRDYPDRILIAFAPAYVADSWGRAVDCSEI